MNILRHIATFAAAALLLCLVPRAAAAQDASSTTGTNGLGLTVSGIVARYTPNGVAYNFRAANLNPNDINYQDCADDIYLEFTLLETGIPTTDTIEVWAGSTDCSQSTARQAATGGPYCWQVASQGQFANATTASGKIYARNITQYIDDTSSEHFTAPTTVPGPEACRTQTTSGAVAISLYFLFIRNDGYTDDSSTVYGQNVDMVGPLAPTLSLPVGIGDGLLLLNWTPQIDSTIQGFQIYAQDQGPDGLGIGAEAGVSTESSQIYCKSGGSQTCVDAGDTGDDGSAEASSDQVCTTVYPDGAALTEVTDSSTLSALSDAELAEAGCQRGGSVNVVTTQPVGGGTCSSNVLVDLFTAAVANTTDDGGGVVEGGTAITTTVDGATVGGTSSVGISEIDASTYGAGNVGGNTTASYNITSVRYPDGGTGRLINGHQYAVAVAAYDDDGNVGALSNLGCQTPAAITDFWDKYKEDGGLSGGSFCSLGAAGAPVAGSVFGAFVGGAAFALGRRGRRRRRRNS